MATCFKMNNQLSTHFKLHNMRLLYDNFDILLYELYTHWSQNKLKNKCITDERQSNTGRKLPLNHSA